jgi:glutamyl-tRNA synthetase
MGTNPTETTTGTPETGGMDVAAIKDQVMGFISNLPQNAGQFFGEYSRPLTTVILIVVALVTLRVLAGVVDTVNQIPFVQPTLELVGIAFSVWFVYRYLLRSENRQELVTKFNALKAEVLGKDS